MAHPTEQEFTWASSLRPPAARRSPAGSQVLSAENSLEFRTGPERQPTEAMRRSRRFAAMVLRRY
ncbi:hypothetical protein ACFQ10_17710 [Streptomyces indonesiensis]